jgi:hypothetical protein
MKDTNTEKGLNDCEVTPQTNPTNIDPVPKLCDDDGFPSQKRVPWNDPQTAWNQQKTQKKTGPPQGAAIGQSGLCDPFQFGQIINDLDTPDRQFIYRYSGALRGCDEAMVDLFRNIKVLDEQGKEHLVPILWANQERAVATILQSNVRKDNSLVVDRIPLPIMSIWANSHKLDPNRFTYQQAFSLMEWLDPNDVAGFTHQEKFERDTVFGVTRGIPVTIGYTLYVWTLYENDMKQIMEQVFSKFSIVAYLRIRGVWWDVIVKLDGTGNNMDIEPGNEKQRVLKYQFDMTAESYIPQPIIRIKPQMPLPVPAPTLADDEKAWIMQELQKGDMLARK